ncbi:putative crinkler family protein [Gigaspora margarita]|uniref:Putative crinkler family protein n=1 Tax=Gigaspora margarita TaxID=4874 RepID=A0A8H3WYS8_GIGMA|nr:putative crinkler family protein [Gigaspora margarita]
MPKSVTSQLPNDILKELKYPKFWSEPSSEWSVKKWNAYYKSENTTATKRESQHSMHLEISKILKNLKNRNLKEYKTAVSIKKELELPKKRALNEITNYFDKQVPLTKRQKSEDEFDEKLSKFWKVLKNVKISGKFLRLSDNNHFFGKQSQPSVVFIRDCYIDLEGIVFDKKIRRLRITGNPGIGKTFFGYYILYKLASKCKTVIYHKVNNDPIIFSNEGSISKENLFSFNQYLNEPETWYIVDGHVPKECEAKTILVCSPKKGNYREFDKYIGSTIRYMPVWTFNEIEECRSNIFNHLGIDKIKNLYMRWGGIPRFVLENAHDKAQQNLLQHAIDTVDETILNYVGETNCPDDVSHKLVHIRTNLPVDEETDVEKVLPYTETYIYFASEYVANEVVVKLKINYKEKLKNFIMASSSINEYGSLRGNIFERVAHQILQGGGTFNIRILEPHSITCKIKIPKRIMLTFDDVNEIKEDMYCKPNRKNFASVDAIVAPNIFFQMTISKIHAIDLNGLEKLYNKLGDHNEIYFYFVVPTDLFENFKCQNFVTGKKIVKQMPSWGKSVKQYALEINLNSW